MESSPGAPIREGRDPTRPRFRPVEVHAGERAGERGLVLIDPLGVAPGQVFIPAELLPIVSRIDGERTADEIERDFAADHGARLPAGFVARLLSRLDEALLLEGPRAEAAIAAACDAFLGHPSGARPARHAGSAGYPIEPRALRQRLAGIAARAPGAARPSPRGLIAPHIDLARGEEGYRRAYTELAACEASDLFVVLGTGHKGPSAPVVGLRLDWATPLGTVSTDREFVAAVHAHLRFPPPPLDALLHREEHSVEFQALFLQHLFGHRTLRIAGFITGQLEVADGAAVIEAFRAAERATGKRACYVAGADLAHVGPAFGDEARVEPARLRALEADDRARLTPVAAGDPAGFLRATLGGGNPDRVCGAVPIYLAAALAGGSAELLHYGQAVAEDGSQAVTFCSMIFR
jgi:AmmeMemoRadiSam system protein B